jgi:hypothetical protein
VDENTAKTLAETLARDCAADLSWSDGDAGETFEARPDDANGNGTPGSCWAVWSTEADDGEQPTAVFAVVRSENEQQPAVFAVREETPGGGRDSVFLHVADGVCFLAA